MEVAMRIVQNLVRGLGSVSLILCLAAGCDDDDGDSVGEESPADAGDAGRDASIDASLRPDGSMDASQGDAARDAALDAAVALTEAQVVGIATTINTGEIEAGTLAQTKGTSADVKEFASMMVSMHGAANTRAAALGITPAPSAPMSGVMQMSTNTLQTLNSLSPGAEFDRNYLQSQVVMHMAALTTFDTVLLPNATTPALVAELQRTRGEVATHLNQARTLIGSLDGGT
jgi:putative membrane protein